MEDDAPPSPTKAPLLEIGTRKMKVDDAIARLRALLARAPPPETIAAADDAGWARACDAALGVLSRRRLFAELPPGVRRRALACAALREFKAGDVAMLRLGRAEGVHAVVCGRFLVYRRAGAESDEDEGALEPASAESDGDGGFGGGGGGGSDGDGPPPPRPDEDERARLVATLHGGQTFGQLSFVHGSGGRNRSSVVVGEPEGHADLGAAYGRVARALLARAG